MTEKNQQMGLKTLTKKGLLYNKIAWGITGVTLIFLALGIISGKVIIELNQRIVQLEQAQKIMAPQGDVASLRDAIATQGMTLTALRSRQEEYKSQLESITRNATISNQLPQQLETQQFELNALKDRLEALKNALPLSSPPVSPTAPSANAEITPKPKPAPKNTFPRKALDQVMHKAPFVLTGVEQRGMASFAAVAPKGFSDLSQIWLVGIGEPFAGWTLVSTSIGQAQFSVNGHVQTISVQ